MDQKKNQKLNQKISIRISNGLDEPFSVTVKRFANVRLLKKKIKMLQGVRVVDQVLSLVTPGRTLQDEETLSDLLIANPSIETKGLKLEVIENPQFKRKCSPPRKSAQVVANTEEAKTPETKSQSQSELFLHRESPSSSSSATTIIVKLSFGEQHRRIPFDRETLTYARLTEFCTQFFGVKNVHRMIFSYVDDEGDKIQLSTDAELKYALQHFAQRPKTDDVPVLKLVFTVKPVAAKPEEKPIGVNPLEATPCEGSKLEQPAPVLLLLQEGREVKDGDIVVLQAERDGQLLNLAYSMKENKVVAARQPPTLPLGVFRKNAQWIVEKVPSKKEKEAATADPEAGKEVFFLSCKCLSIKGEEKKKKNLRSLANGQVNHQGGRGLWARFEILTSPEGKASLRSVGRSARNFENNFLGIVKNNKEFSVSANLDANSDDAKFTLQFV